MTKVSNYTEQQLDLLNPDTWDDVPEVGGFESEVWTEDYVLVGFLAGRRINVGPNKSNMYEFDTRDGKVAVWGSTVLDGRLEDVPEGALVRLEWTGVHQGAENSYKTYSVKFRPVSGQHVTSAVSVSNEPPY